MTRVPLCLRRENNLEIDEVPAPRSSPLSFGDCRPCPSNFAPLLVGEGRG